MEKEFQKMEETSRIQKGQKIQEEERQKGMSFQRDSNINLMILFF